MTFDSTLVLLAQPGYLAFACMLLGLMVGSFLNVVIHRLPQMMQRDWLAQCAELRGEDAPVQEKLSLATPRSRCPHCGHMIAALENIPILSWIVLRGRCRHCQAPISLRYPLVEAVSGLLSAYAGWHFGFGLATAAALLFLWCMIALTCIDFDTQLLPDDITLPLLWFGLLFNLVGGFCDLRSAVIGAMAGYLSLWSVYWGFKLVTGKEGMGYGDFKLLAAIGAWLGWQMLPLAILLSSLVGAVVGISLIIINRRGRDIPIPFGPYLATAGTIALFWGKPLTQAYLRLI
ncbi:MAG: prepilin peptidase [Betaproteobacteria bacterium]|nr:prepilin peptidase [Betaproteobacteria bacterium]